MGRKVEEKGWGDGGGEIVEEEIRVKVKWVRGCLCD